MEGTRLSISRAGAGTRCKLSGCCKPSVSKVTDAEPAEFVGAPTIGSSRPGGCTRMKGAHRDVLYIGEGCRRSREDRGRLESYLPARLVTDLLPLVASPTQDLLGLTDCAAVRLTNRDRKSPGDAGIRRTFRRASRAASELGEAILPPTADATYVVADATVKEAATEFGSLADAGDLHGHQMDRLWRICADLPSGIISPTPHFSRCRQCTTGLPTQADLFHSRQASDWTWSQLERCQLAATEFGVLVRAPAMDRIVLQHGAAVFPSKARGEGSNSLARTLAAGG